MTGQAVVQDFLARLTERDLEGFLALFCEDAVMEMPFAPKGAPHQLVGMSQLRSFWTIVFASMQSMRFDDVDIDDLANSNRVVSFHRGEVTLADGSPYNNRYACLFELDVAGKIARYVEHYDSMIVVRSFGGEDQLAKLFGSL
jgi:uncharacterized protein